MMRAISLFLTVLIVTFAVAGGQAQAQSLEALRKSGAIVYVFPEFLEDDSQFEQI